MCSTSLSLIYSTHTHARPRIRADLPSSHSHKRAHFLPFPHRTFAPPIQSRGKQLRQPHPTIHPSHRKRKSYLNEAAFYRMLSSALPAHSPAAQTRAAEEADSTHSGSSHTWRVAHPYCVHTDAKADSVVFILEDLKPPFPRYACTFGFRFPLPFLQWINGKERGKIQT